VLNVFGISRHKLDFGGLLDLNLTLYSFELLAE